MSGLNILIVDASPVGGGALRQLLAETDRGYRILATQTVEDARERLRACGFDCIFVNIRSEDADSMTMTPVVAVHRLWPAAAVIVTGSGDEREVVAAMRSGAVDYVSRARIGVEMLRRTIENGVCAARQEQDARDLRARLNHLAMFDGRTGLPSRPLFCDRLGHALLTARRNRQNLAVMVMNLDFFRDVNRRFGRALGDDVLVRVGGRVRSVMRSSDTLARLHGDEFASLLPGVESSDAAAVVAEKIIGAVGAPIDICGEAVEIGISIGIAMFPIDGQGPEALFDNADAAMYRAKRGTRGYTFHRGDAAAGARPSRLTRQQSARSS
ncbi:MAG TPA: diguanylate cyclase [Alphaproteobacteria bacterium]|nr:diguanylate cyclase [Alphaproteobacteria bacterium]